MRRRVKRGLFDAPSNVDAITVTLSEQTIADLDKLAIDIRLRFHRKLTRSAIIGAFIEAEIRRNGSS